MTHVLFCYRFNVVSQQNVLDIWRDVVSASVDFRLSAHYTYINVTQFLQERAILIMKNLSVQRYSVNIHHYSDVVLVVGKE